MRTYLTDFWNLGSLSLAFSTRLGGASDLFLDGSVSLALFSLHFFLLLNVRIIGVRR